MALDTESRPRAERATVAGDGAPSPKQAVAWLGGGAALTFLVSWLGTDVLELQHDLFYLLYFTFALGYLGWFTTRAPGTWRALLRDNAWWSLGIGAVIAVAAVRQVMSLDGTPHPTGAFFVFELVWRGVVYGAVDALVLAVFPAAVAYLVLRRDRTGLARKAAFAGLVLVFSLVVSTAYHLGYPTYRGQDLRKPLIGTVMLNVPAMLTGNPIGALVLHPAAHTTAVVHQYYGGSETNQMLPPELNAGYADQPGGTVALGIAAGWVVLAGSAIAYGRRRRED